MKREIVIFHFLPVEIFPPIMNFLEFLSQQNNGIPVTVITTYPNSELNLYKNNWVNIIRCKNIEASSSVFVKIARYLKIYFTTFYYLIKLKPRVVFYFETLSSLPPLIYKRLFKKAKLYIHYHEIVTLDELKSGRVLNKILNIFEQRLYEDASWISQTNLIRMNIFLEQYQMEFEHGIHNVLPNYPSKNWLLSTHNLDSKQLKQKDNVIKLVHIGALSFEGMYLNKLLQTFGNNKKFEIYFYSHTTNEEIIKKLKTFDNVYFRGSINYNDIPKLRNEFDVGLVLYNGNSVNFTYNAPNKIFEYLALDLDVWCSDKLITAGDYVNQDTYPKMSLIDFENFPMSDIDNIISREGLEYKSSPYVCELVYKPLFDRMRVDVSC